MITNKNVMLFFRDQADEANVDGIDDQLCIPASRLVSISPASDTTVAMYFDSVKNNVHSHNAQLQYDTVVLTVTQGDTEEVLAALVQKINAHPKSDGFLVIADDCATTDSAVTALNDKTISTSYAHPSIEGVASITVADKLYRSQTPSLGTGNTAMTGISATALSVNTHYKGATATALAMTIPAAAAGKAGDWITVTYTTAIDNGAAHTYTSTTDTSFAAGSVLIGLPGADDDNGTRVGRVDECSGSGDNVVTITGLTDGDGGIGTTLKFINMTGTTNGWAVEGMITHRDKGNAASTVAFS